MQETMRDWIIEGLEKNNPTQIFKFVRKGHKISRVKVYDSEKELIDFNLKDAFTIVRVCENPWLKVNTL